MGRIVDWLIGDPRRGIWVTLAAGIATAFYPPVSPALFVVAVAGAVRMPWPEFRRREAWLIRLVFAFTAIAAAGSGVVFAVAGMPWAVITTAGVVGASCVIFARTRVEDSGASASVAQPDGQA